VSENNSSSSSKKKKPEPLFYRKRTNARGETDEMSLGACCVNVVRCLVVLVLGILLLIYGADPLLLLRLLLKLLA
jgi:hypothetical protein